MGPYFSPCTVFYGVAKRIQSEVQVSINLKSFIKLKSKPFFNRNFKWRAALNIGERGKSL